MAVVPCNIVSRLATDDTTSRDALWRSENGHVSTVATLALGETDLLLIRKLMRELLRCEVCEKVCQNGQWQ